jgi:hypothetical protein
MKFYKIDLENLVNNLNDILESKQNTFVYNNSNEIVPKETLNTEII